MSQKLGLFEKWGRPLWGGLVTLVAVSGIFYYLDNYPIPEWSIKLFSLVTAAFLVVGCWSLGDLLLSWRIHKEPTFSAEPVLRWWILPFAVGAALVSALVLILGWALPFDLRIKMKVLVWVLAGISFLQISKNKSHLSLNVSFSIPYGVGGLLGSLLGAGGFLTVLIVCFSPITYYDSLVYHLALPFRYLMDGKIHSIPFNLYSAFPAGFEMLFMPIMALSESVSPDYAVNLLGLMFSLSASLLVWHWAQQLGGEKAGFLALVLWWTMPATLLLSMGAYVDIPLCFFVGLSIYSFLKSTTDLKGTTWLILAGLFGSMAASIKYTGGLTLFILFVFLVFSGLKRENFWRRLTFFSAASLFPFSFWLLKNWIELGNPFFPFLYRYLGGSVEWTAATADGYFRMLTEYGETSQLIKQIFSLIWSASTNGITLGGGMDVLGDFGWGLLIFASIGVVSFKKLKPGVNFLWLYLVIHMAVWASTKPVLRFLLGAVPVFIVLSSLSLERFYQFRSKLVRGATFFFMSLWLVSNVFVFALIVGDLQLFSVATGRESAASFLERRLAIYSSYQYLAKNASTLAPALIIGEQRVYPLEISYQSSNLFAPSMIASFCNDNDLNGLVSFFQKEKIQSVLLNSTELMRLGGPKALGFTDSGWGVLSQFIETRTQPVSDDKGIKIHRIVT